MVFFPLYRATTILGYLPQELLGTSCYEYFHQDDLPQLADRHRKGALYLSVTSKLSDTLIFSSCTFCYMLNVFKSYQMILSLHCLLWSPVGAVSSPVLRSKEKIETNSYKFKTKHGSFVTLQSQWFSFINPWTKEVEYIVSSNTVIS